MFFLTRFFGSFYSQALYTRLRSAEAGYGVHYSLLLFGFIAVISTTIVLVAMPKEMQDMLPQMQTASPVAWIVIFAVAILLRALMLLTLAIAARLIAMRLKLPMDYASGFRLAGVAYTPVAICDAVVFCIRIETMSPMLLFGCGVAMLLAVLYSTR